MGIMQRAYTAYEIVKLQFKVNYEGTPIRGGELNQIIRNACNCSVTQANDIINRMIFAGQLQIVH